MNSPRSIVYGGSGYVPNGSGNQSITTSTGILMTGDESNNESTPFISSTSSSNSNDQQQQNKILIGNIVPISSSSNHAGSMIDHQSGEKRGDQTSQAQVSNIFSPKNVLLFRICFLLFIDVLAYSMCLPLLPEVILETVDGDAGKAAVYQGLAASLDGFLKFIMQPMLGRHSDRVGRRPLLLYSQFGSAMTFMVFLVKPSILTLFLSHVTHGVTQATFLVCMSAVADISHNPNDSSGLTYSYGLIGVSMGAAFVFGPASGGALARYLDSKRAVYIISTGIYILGAFFVLLLFPETKGSNPQVYPSKYSSRTPSPNPQNNNSSASEALASEIQSFRSKGFDVFFPWQAARELFKKSHPSLRLLMLGYLSACFTTGIFGIWVLFLKTRWAWTSKEIGMFLSANGFVVVISQGILVRYLIPNRLSEGHAAMIAYVCNSLMFIGVAFATKPEYLVGDVVTLGLICAMGDPSIKSLMAHRVPHDEQGALQGILGSIFTFSQIISPPFYSLLFRHFISEDYIDVFPYPCEPNHHKEKCGGFPGFPFLVQSIFYIIAALIVRTGLHRAELDGAKQPEHHV